LAAPDTNMTRRRKQKREQEATPEEAAFLNAAEGTPEYEAAKDAMLEQVMRERKFQHPLFVSDSKPMDDVPRAHRVLMGGQSFLSVYMVAWGIWHHTWRIIPIVALMSGLCVKILDGVRSKDGSKGGTAFVTLLCMYITKIAMGFVQGSESTEPDEGSAAVLLTLVDGIAYTLVATVVVGAMAFCVTRTTNAVMYSLLNGVGAFAVYTEGYGGIYGAVGILCWAGVFIFLAPKGHGAPARAEDGKGFATAHADTLRPQN